MTPIRLETILLRPIQIRNNCLRTSVADPYSIKTFLLRPYLWTSFADPDSITGHFAQTHPDPELLLMDQFGESGSDKRSFFSVPSRSGIITCGPVLRIRIRLNAFLPRTIQIRNNCLCTSFADPDSMESKTFWSGRSRSGMITSVLRNWIGSFHIWIRSFERKTNKN